MKIAWIEKRTRYDGTQLRSHWIFDQTGILGDAIVSFMGPADVPTSNMADLVDVKNDSPIFSNSMLHVIAEHFDRDLTLAIARQRLLVATAADLIRPALTSVSRSGNDLYSEKRKLSVSIATVSPVSALIHFAVNIESSGTPVPTLGFSDFGVDPRRFAESLMQAYADESDSMLEARCKVRAVK